MGGKRVDVCAIIWSDKVVAAGKSDVDSAARSDICSSRREDTLPSVSSKGDGLVCSITTSAEAAVEAVEAVSVGGLVEKKRAEERGMRRDANLEVRRIARCQWL